MTDTDVRHMRHALALAGRGAGRVWPWPSVGCVIVKRERIVGRGVSDRDSRRHAEVVALAQAGPEAAGATVYVTLEPCSHHGSTPPCADALVAAKVARVVASVQDPNPLVSGQGFERLQRAGVTVEMGVCADKARAIHAGFMSVIEGGRPAVTLKLASTLDGRIATASGESRWITGPDARRMVHAMRARHDAVLVGAGTVRADDPSLTVRDLGTRHQPVRVVASRHLRLPPDSVLARTAHEVPVWILCGDTALETKEADAWRRAGAELLPVTAHEGQITPAVMLKALSERGITRVFCEGGGMLAASMLTDECVDDLIVFSAGKLIGAEGQPSVGPLGVLVLTAAPQFQLTNVQNVGGDVMQHWKRAL